MKPWKAEQERELRHRESLGPHDAATPIRQPGKNLGGLGGLGAKIWNVRRPCEAISGAPRFDFVFVADGLFGLPGAALFYRLREAM